MGNIIRGVLRATAIRKEAERIDPDAGWADLSPHIVAGYDYMNERQREAILQAKLNIRNTPQANRGKG